MSLSDCPFLGIISLHPCQDHVIFAQPVLGGALADAQVPQGRLRFGAARLD